mmetsp:Transcript_7085/g.12683  ORF Transcript_7085/g.12683 Transcript_7085/m.12683 type:complete len:217 (+) Transcript_7085:444-1094(+)
MLLRLHNINRACAAVYQVAGTSQVAQRCCSRYEAINETFWHLLAIRSEDHVCEHVMPHVADQSDGTTCNGGCISLLVSIPNVWVHDAIHGLSVLDKGCLQLPPENTANIAVDTRFICSINCRHRILHVQDRRQGALHGDILDATQCAFTNRIITVNLQDEVQAIVLQEDAAYVRHFWACLLRHSSSSFRRPKLSDGSHKQRWTPETRGATIFFEKL